MSVKLFVAIPNYRDSVPGLFLDCMVSLTAHLARRFGPGELEYMRIGMTLIDEARNRVWRAAKKASAENLLFIDDDMTFTPEMFDTVWNTPGDIKAPLFFMRSHPPRPAIYHR